MPPFDPTMAPSVNLPLRAPSNSAARPVLRPILASECLREDIAPSEPFPRATRAAIAGSAAALAVAAALMAQTSLARSGALAIAAIVAMAAALGRDYHTRGVLSIGAIAGLLAAPSLATVAAIPLAAALFVRASYRAHRGTRRALAASVTLFAVAVAFAAVAAFSSGGTVAARVVAVGMGAVAAASLLGFMGEETTGLSTTWGALALLTAAASVLVRAPLSVGGVAAALGALAAGVCASVGVYAVAATAIAPVERARDVRASVPPPPASNDA